MPGLNSHHERDFYFVFTETGVVRLRRLPLEVITTVFEFLPQADLRRAASASREFSDAALVAGLEIRRSLILGALSDPAPDTLLAVVDHISAKNRRMGLALTLEGAGSPDSPELLPALQALTKALPVLTRIVATVPFEMCAKFYDALAGPAPRLRTFVLSQRCGLLSPAPVPLPPALFGGSAPRLRHVVVNGPVSILGSDEATIIPAFAHVRQLALNCSSSAALLPPLVVARSFPAVRTLELNIGRRSSKDSKPRTIDLSGLALERLAVHGSAALQFVVSPERVVPTVEYTCGPIAYHAPLWPGRGRELNAHIRCLPPFGGLLVAVGTTEADRRLAINNASLILRKTEGGLEPLAHLPPLQTQLVSLTLDEKLLPHLVGTPHTLAVLRELLVDCTPKIDANARDIAAVPERLRRRGDTRVDPKLRDQYIGLAMEYMPGMSPAFAAPALKSVTAFARGGTTQTPAPRVESRKFAALGLALGLLKVQPREQRAELVLAGVVLDDPAFDKLRVTYGAVRHLGSAEGVVPRYCE